MDRMSNLCRVNLLGCVSVEFRTRKGGDVTEDACGLVDDGVQVPGVHFLPLQ
jgi:hypothetical protein